MAILAAQIEKSAPGTNRHRRHGHALEHEVGVAVEQHAILEGARLALVGVADDDATAANRHRRIAAGIPFQCRRETGPATPAQAGAAQSRRSRRPARQACGRPSRHERELERRVPWAGCDRVPPAVRHPAAGRHQQDVAAADIVGHDEQFGRPVRQGHLAPDQLAELVDARPRQGEE